MSRFDHFESYSGLCHSQSPQIAFFPRLWWDMANGLDTTVPNTVIGCSWYMFQLQIYTDYRYSIDILWYHSMISFYDIILISIFNQHSIIPYMVLLYLYIYHMYFICSFWYYCISYPMIWPSQGAQLRSQTHWSPAHRTTRHHPPDRGWDMIHGMIEEAPLGTAWRDQEMEVAEGNS